MKKALQLLIVLFSLCAVMYASETEVVNDSESKIQESELTTITIKNARHTNYKKDEETGNDIILLEGAVEISVEKNNTSSDIKADKITYDRATEMLYAEGGVEIITKGSSSSGGETTTANSLLLNTSTLEGVFDGGKVVQTKSDALNLPSGSTLIVFSEAFGKGNDNVITFKNSSLTFCEDENPHWHIDASRTWLLPGGEFAFLNALLYVGPVPVLYLPAFYYPKDELIFNPVFSFKEREGYSIQTTTYLHGRKGLDKSVVDNSNKTEEDKNDKISSEALYNFMKPTTLKEQRLEGLVLHNLDEDFKGDTSEYLKVMLDWYSNLGLFLGVDGKYSPSDYITNLEFFLNMGFSRTVFPDGNGFTGHSNTGKTYNDYSTFLGMTLPFRYAANIDFSLSKPFNLTVSLPVYSDPYFISDFKTERRESMDWISFLLDDNSDSKPYNRNANEISSFAWAVNGSYSFPIPDFIKPYINNLYISLNSSINFASRYADSNYLTYEGDSDVDSEWKENSPTRSFYYPSLIKPGQLNLNVSGNLFNWPLNKTVKTESTPDFPIALNKPESLKTPQEKEEENKSENVTKDKETKEDENKESDFEFYFPELSVETPEITKLTGLSYNLGYNFDADFITQIAYPSSNLKVPEDFDWSNIQSYMYTLRTPLTVKGTLKYGQDFFTMSNSIQYSPIFQEHPYLSTDETTGGYSKSSIESIKLADFKAERQDIFSTNSITLKPLTYIDMFKKSSITWNTNFKLYRREFVGTADNPDWEHKFLDITDDKSFIENSLSVLFSATEMEDLFSQSLLFTCVMPPLLTQYKTKLTLGFPFVTTSLETGFYETTKDDVPADQKWKKNPLVQNLTISLFDSSLSFSETYSYSLEEYESESLRLSASWQGLSISYLMSNTYGYDFDKVNGWKIRDEKEFLPYSLSVVYNMPKKTFHTWSDRITFSPNLSTSIVADLIRPTNSYFLFTPGISFEITDLLTFTFSATTKNSVLYWYFNNDEGDLYSEWGGFPGNIFKDLFDSFRFDDRSIREKSGFKLKSLNFDLNHDLHDWKFNMSLKLEPRVVTENGSRRYDFNPYFTIGIVWKPMESLKTEIIDEYGEWEIH